MLVQLNQISAVANNCYLQWLMQDTCSYNPTLPYTMIHKYLDISLLVTYTL